MSLTSSILTPEATPGSSPTPSSSLSPSPSSKKPVAVGAQALIIIAIACGALFVILVSAIIVIYLRRRRRSNQLAGTESENGTVFTGSNSAAIRHIHHIGGHHRHTSSDLRGIAPLLDHELQMQQQQQGNRSHYDSTYQYPVSAFVNSDEDGNMYTSHAHTISIPPPGSPAPHIVLTTPPVLMDYLSPGPRSARTPGLMASPHFPPSPSSAMSVRSFDSVSLYSQASEYSQASPEPPKSGFVVPPVTKTPSLSRYFKSLSRRVSSSSSTAGITKSTAQPASEKVTVASGGPDNQPLERSETALVGHLLKSRADRVSKEIDSSVDLTRSASQVSHIERSGSIRGAPSHIIHSDKPINQRLSQVKRTKAMKDVNVPSMEPLPEGDGNNVSPMESKGAENKRLSLRSAPQYAPRRELTMGSTTRSILYEEDPFDPRNPDDGRSRPVSMISPAATPPNSNNPFRKSFAGNSATPLKVQSAKVASRRSQLGYDASVRLDIV